MNSSKTSRRRWTISLACLGAITAGTTFAADPPSVSRFPMGMAYASNAVNTPVFRVSAVVTAAGHQFAAYYDPNGNVVVARREIGDSKWDLAVQSFKGKNFKDAHNDIVLGVSSDGILHLSYDHHSDPLHYRISSKPYDVHSFGDMIPMTGQTEDHVTYPQFISAPDGTLYFFYRDGASGNGTLCLNRYDIATKTWQAVQHPLVDGENKCNPYWWRPAIGPDGAIHLAWCWRDSPDAATNHDLCYARSNDGGKTWLRSDGKPQELPITQENAEVVEPIKKNSNLINQCSAAVDASGNPHLAEYFSDDAGIPQYFDVWFDGTTWHKNQVSHRTSPFHLGGGGTLAIPISRPEIAITKTGTACLITREADNGGGIRLYEAKAPYQNWTPIDLTKDDLGNWEPSYDQARLLNDNVLSLFVLPVQQGNHERTTGFPPQQATILETPLP
jgi:BNR repeat-containing family member